MLPHPDTVSVLHQQRRRELLASVARERLSRQQATALPRRPTAHRSLLNGLAALLTLPRWWRRGLRRTAQLGERLPPAA